MQAFPPHPIDARAVDAESLGDNGGAPMALRLHLAYLRHVYRSGPAFVHALRLGLRDTFKLGLAPQVGFKLGKHAKHVEEALARRGTRVDRLFGRFERGALDPDCSYDVLQVADRAGGRRIGKVCKRPQATVRPILPKEGQP